MSLKFGTSGLRGLVPDLLSGASRRYAAAFAAHLLASGRARPGDNVFVARDLRDSSAAIATDCMAGLADAGLVPVDCGELPTPALALHAMSRSAACLMVTGSHIPADRNGLKFYRPDGEIDKEDEAAISRLVEGISRPRPTAAGSVKNHADTALELYRSRYQGALAPDALAGMRIGIYDHSTVARDILAEIVGNFGADIVRLGRSATFIPVDTEAVSADMAGLLRGWAASERLDAILSADGDGDRPLVADETGRHLRGDLLGLVSALRLKADVVVTPVTTNSGVASDRGFAVIRTRVGSPYVIEGMANAVARGDRTVIGFEANGGLLTATPVTLNGMELVALPTRDSVLPMLCVLAAAAETGISLSRLAADLALPVAASGRVEAFAAEDSRAMIDWLADDRHAERFADGLGAVTRIDRTDGVQIFFDGDAMVHFRASGNAPEMRCYGEAPERERAEALVRTGVERIEAFRAQRRVNAAG